MTNIERAQPAIRTEIKRIRGERRAASGSGGVEGVAVVENF